VIYVLARDQVHRSVVYTLRNFKRKSGTLWNFSCPICGDSQKDLRKARAYIYVKEGNLAFTVTMAVERCLFQSFIKTVDEFVYNDYVIEKMMENPKQEPDPILTMKKPKYITDTAQRTKESITASHDHYCRAYVDGRQIPTTFHHRLFYAYRFMAWVNTFVPGKFDEAALKFDRPALVIPFINREGRLHAASGSIL
jgi:hypothetical protein